MGEEAEGGRKAEVVTAKFHGGISHGGGGCFMGQEICDTVGDS